MTDDEKNDDEKKEMPEPNARRDYVGRSGVYPMSGPQPPGKAVIRGQMEWGQGERGAAGYEDHGSSELSLQGGIVVGGLDQEWPEMLDPASPVSPYTARDIPLTCWPLFCDWFSSHHRGLSTTVVIRDQQSNSACEARRLPLTRMQAHVLDNDIDGISVQLDRVPSKYLLNITTPKRLTYSQDANGSPKGITIEQEQGCVALSFQDTE